METSHLCCFTDDVVWIAQTQCLWIFVISEGSVAQERLTPRFCCDDERELSVEAKPSVSLRSCTHRWPRAECGDRKRWGGEDLRVDSPQKESVEVVEHLTRMPNGRFLDDLFPPGRVLQGGDRLRVWKHLSVPPEEPELAGKSERNQKIKTNPTEVQVFLFQTLPLGLFPTSYASLCLSCVKWTRHNASETSVVFAAPCCIEWVTGPTCVQCLQLLITATSL